MLNSVAFAWGKFWAVGAIGQLWTSASGAQETAFATIQPAIDAVGAAPMIVRVEPGQYPESLVFGGKPVVLTSADPNSPHEYFLSSGPAGGPVATFAGGEDSRTVLRGFLLRQGSGRNNGDGSPIILIRGSAPVIEDNVIQGNTALSAGGGIRIEGPSPNSDSPMIRRNQIGANNAERGAGIAVLNASANIENNVIHENGLNSPQSLAGGGIYVSAPAGRHVAITNNTIVANRAAQGGGIFVEGEATVELVKSIVAFQQGGGGLSRHPSRVQPVSVRYSNFWQNSGGNWINLPDPTGQDGNLTLDPLLVGLGLASLAGTRAAGDHWIPYATHSPLIDAGDPASDFSLESPPNGARINMGAYGGTERASRSIDQPLVSNMSTEDGIRFLVRNGRLDSPLPITITSTGTAVLDRDFQTIPSPLIIPAGKTLLPVRISAIPGTLLSGQPSATLEVASHPSYLLPTPAAFFFPVPLLPYNEWLKQELPLAWHSSAERTDPQNDPDGQGIPNLLRFAFRMTSSATERSNMPRTEIRQIGTGETSNPYLSLTYVRLPPSAGLNYILEGSSDLLEWTVIEDPEVLESEPLPDAERVTVRDENPLSSGSTRFLRLRVEFAE